MLVRLVACIACAVILSACDRLREAKLIGTWRYEDEDGIEEISIRSDHSFSRLQTYKKELVTPSPLEEMGSWQLKGDQLLLDLVDTWSKERRQRSRTLVEVSRTALITKGFDDSKNLTYKRLKETTCAPSSNAIAALSEAALLGSWQTHANTHDYQYRFTSGARIALFGLISDKWQLLLEGEWRIKDGRLVIQFRKDPSGPVEREEDVWTITAMGTNCLAVNGAFSRPYILQRVK
jgi:hypothetical protein